MDPCRIYRTSIRAAWFRSNRTSAASCQSRRCCPHNFLADMDLFRAGLFDRRMRFRCGRTSCLFLVFVRASLRASRFPINCRYRCSSTTNPIIDLQLAITASAQRCGITYSGRCCADLSKSAWHWCRRLRGALSHLRFVKHVAIIASLMLLQNVATRAGLKGVAA